MIDRKNTTIKVLPVLALRELLVFPHTVVPLFVGREKSIKSLELAMSNNREIFLVAQKKMKSTEPLPEDIYEYGTIGQILQLLRLPDGTVKILVEGKKRGHIIRFVEKEEILSAEIEEIPEFQVNQTESEAIVRAVKSAFDTYVKLNKRIPPEATATINAIENENKLADTLVVQLSHIKLLDKQKILETIDPLKRLEELYSIIQSENDILRVEKKIRARVKRNMEKTQREYYLNEQITAIQKELGNVDDIRTEISEIEAKLKINKLSKEAEEKVRKELKKLRTMSPMSAEATVIRNYIDNIMALPWGEYTKILKDPVLSETILEEDHYGLEKVKERILEYLTVNTLSDKMRGPILCLVGPPGVGKTSLAKSVARATGRNFARLSLGGVRDEAEIRGHRRTYIGAMPGKILNSIKKAGSSNPVILLDEIDKMNSDYRGDPASAMLEVLDPEQNHSFNDHYLDLDFDLSQILFLATANSLHNIPRPLLDRMEIIHLGGYTEYEKIAISKQYLIPKNAEYNGLNKISLEVQNSALEELIRYYTREAGVRNLEREISSIFRKLAREILKEQIKLNPNFIKSATKIIKIDSPLQENSTVDSKNEIIVLENITAPDVNDILVKRYLGAHRYSIGLMGEKNEIGVCQGLAFTEVGGELLITEVSVVIGKGNLKVTGKLGEVMQESAQAAFTYIRSRASFLGLEEDFYSKIDIHMHFPEGAIPKDGPSAGITMATALASAITKRAISSKIAMTGEITLRGRVLAIGGLKEKLLAAHRAGIRKVIIPSENKKDLAELPKNVLDNMEIIFANHMDTVLYHAFAWEEKDELFQKLQKEYELSKLKQ